MSEQMVADSLVDGDATFAEPWQARAFALAVAVTDEKNGSGLGSWSAFRERLVREIDDAESAPALLNRDEPVELDGDEDRYYRQWLSALERLLADGGIDENALRERALAFERGERDAHEFVNGDPHGHAADLPEGHADGSDHDHSHDHEHHQ
ncbi:MAG: nitrile hydratase accessory protein [Halolamina sp.]|uniref:nitrile hydratase accessory protein n=1 Tax=Halolamina sp. TaxID=1940283 RepID=UPI002FC2D774